jgi:hypothetical protein
MLFAHALIGDWPAGLPVEACGLVRDKSPNLVDRVGVFGAG